MIVAAFKKGSKRAYTKNAHQFDKGQKLIVTGIVLPDSYEVHISNEQEGGMAYSCLGNAEGIYIPDAFFVKGDFVYVWIYATEEIREGEAVAYDIDPEEEVITEKKVAETIIHEGETVYEIVIPVKRRSIQLPTVKDPYVPESGFGYIVDENEALIPVGLS